MLVSAAHPELWLLTASAVDGYEGPHRERLAEVVRWSREHLVADHPDLGRSGAVCPYTQPCLDRGLLWLTVHPGARPSLDRLASDAVRFGDWFLELPPRDGRFAQFKAILILLPELPAERGPDVIDVVQRALKPSFVARGLMIGQFYPGCTRPGLWNPDFRPLSSTVPLLTLRHMVAADAGFLTDQPVHLAAYLERFGDAVPHRLRGTVRAAKARLGVG